MPQRPRRSPQDTQPPPPDGVVICTDRRRHRLVRIAVFDYEPGNGDGVRFSQTSRWDVIAGALEGSELTYRFKCKLCCRDIRLRDANAQAAVAVLRAGFRGEGPLPFDVSALPC